MPKKRKGKPPRLYEFAGGRMSARQFAELLHIPLHRAWYCLRKTGGGHAAGLDHGGPAAHPLRRAEDHGDTDGRKRGQWLTA